MTGPREPGASPPPGGRLERSPLRLLLEGVVGAAGGAVLARVVPGGEGHLPAFIAVGALAAPAALLLTPLRGSLGYRSLRYGAALATLVVLVVSFAAGAEGIRLEELLALGLVLALVGAGGHAVLALMVDRAGERPGEEASAGEDSGEGGPMDSPPGPG